MDSSVSNTSFFLVNMYFYLFFWLANVAFDTLVVGGLFMETLHELTSYKSMISTFQYGRYLGYMK
jgi:hypothetical protein